MTGIGGELLTGEPAVAAGTQYWPSGVLVVSWLTTNFTGLPPPVANSVPLGKPLLAQKG